MEEEDNDPIALYVLVVGFHHKKGMQVDYCYPPLSGNDCKSCELPELWRHLPSLCLPDGAHNHESDTIFFHLPHLTDKASTVYGVSCYRQIDAEERLQVTTRVYFKGADFSDVRDLEGLYHDLNTANWRDKLHHGVSVSDAVRVFGRNLLVLFKLVLLERCVLLYHSPVAPVVRTIASLLALLPHSLPGGVRAAAALSNFAEPSSKLDKETSGSADSYPDNCSAEPLAENVCSLDCDVAGHCNSTKNHVVVKSSASAGDVLHNRSSSPTDSATTASSAKKDHRMSSRSSSAFAVISKSNAKEEDSAQIHNTSPLVKRDGRCSDDPGVANFVAGGCSVGACSVTQRQQSADAQSVDSSVAIASTQATTGADTPTNTFQDSMSDLHSSNSSLTSVTSRASFMSHLRTDAVDGESYDVTTHSVDEPGLLTSPPLSSRLSSLKGRLSGAISYWTGRDKTSSALPSPYTPVSSPAEEVGLDVLQNNSNTPETPLVYPELQQATQEQQGSVVTQLVPSPPEVFAGLEPHDCGLPLPLFAEGYQVHPYLSLLQLDLISSDRMRAFLAGASNTLFLHKRSLYDVLVQVAEGKVEMLDPELRRQLSLSTEDLRFADNIVRQVEAVIGSGGGSTVSSPSVSNFPNGFSGASASSMIAPLDVWVEGVGWVGGEEWLRHQFRVYLISMLRTSLLPEGCREVEMFNSSFMAAWRSTRHYQQWLSAGPYPALNNITPCHPNAGHLSMADLKLRLAHSLLGGERSRRINQTLVSTGTAVVRTKEAVGGALTSARGALSSLWSSITTTNVDDTHCHEVGEVASGEDAEEALNSLGDGGRDAECFALGLPQDSDWRPTTAESEDRGTEDITDNLQECVAVHRHVQHEKAETLSHDENDLQYDTCDCGDTSHCHSANGCEASPGDAY